MAHLFLAPEWFVGYDVILQFIFGLITLFVSVFAFKIYKLIKDPQPKLLGISFLCFSFAYFIQAIINFNIFTKLNENICAAVKIITVEGLVSLEVYIHIALFTLGLMTLVYMSLKKYTLRTYAVLFVLTFLSLVFAVNKIFFFYVLSSFLLLFIFIYYLQNYLKHKKTHTLLVFIAFFMLFLASIVFVFSLTNTIHYAVAHLIELVAYTLLLVNLIMVSRR